MKQFTDPKLTNSASPGAGETNVNSCVHVQELRNEVMLASLFDAHLDERSVRTASTQSPEGDPANLDLQLTGSGVIRSIWAAGAEIEDGTGLIKIWIDGEAQPRVNCSVRQFFFSTAYRVGAFLEDQHGRTKLAGYRMTPIPFHTSIRIMIDCHFSNVVYNYSSTVDFDYGRYNQFHFDTKTFSGAGTYALLDVSGKKGALYGLYYDMRGSDGMLEGDTEFTADGVWNGQSGTEDLFFCSYYFEDLFDYPTKTVNLTKWPNLHSAEAGITDFHQHGTVNSDNQWGMYRYFRKHPVVWDSTFALRWLPQSLFPNPSTLNVALVYYTAS